VTRRQSQSVAAIWLPSSRVQDDQPAPRTESGRGLIGPRRVTRSVLPGGTGEGAGTLAPLREFASRHSLSVTTHHVIRHAAECVAAFATAQQPDLIIMGSHGHSVTANLVLGSAAARILARCGIRLLSFATTSLQSQNGINPPVLQLWWREQRAAFQD